MPLQYPIVFLEVLDNMKNYKDFEKCFHKFF